MQELGSRSESFWPFTIKQLANIAESMEQQKLQSHCVDSTEKA